MIFGGSDTVCPKIGHSWHLANDEPRLSAETSPESKLLHAGPSKRPTSLFVPCHRAFAFETPAASDVRIQRFSKPIRSLHPLVNAENHANDQSPRFGKPRCLTVPPACRKRLEASKWAFYWQDNILVEIMAAKCTTSDLHVG
jgi:hypothetical protein